MKKRIEEMTRSELYAEADRLMDSSQFWLRIAIGFQCVSFACFVIAMFIKVCK